MSSLVRVLDDVIHNASLLVEFEQEKARELLVRSAGSRDNAHNLANGIADLPVLFLLV